MKPTQTSGILSAAGPEVLGADDERIVDLSEDLPVLPDTTRDDTDHGWGEHPGGNDDRLLEDRPPHWG